MGELPRRYVKILEEHNYKWPPVKARPGQVINAFIFISLGKKHLHDSGFPFIVVLGADDNGNLYDLGCHDHIAFYDVGVVNMDSLGANVFRAWLNQPAVIEVEWIPSSLGVYANDPIAKIR